MYKVSVIIPTYNRHKLLLKAIESVKNQTYKNIEIIVVNDGSTDSEYYEKIFTERNDIKLVNLFPNSKKYFENKLTITNGLCRNIGFQFSTGEYIAFLDDDDYWLPSKIETQINAMIENKIDFCCSDGFIGYEEYSKDKKYMIYNQQYFFHTIKNIYENKKIIFNEFPKFWDLSFLQIHNCCITSSVIVKRTLLEKEQFKSSCFAEDYDLWLRFLKITDVCLYISTPLFYYQLKE